MCFQFYYSEEDSESTAPTADMNWAAASASFSPCEPSRASPITSPRRNCVTSAAAVDAASPEPLTAAAVEMSAGVCAALIAAASLCNNRGPLTCAGTYLSGGHGAWRALFTLVEQGEGEWRERGVRAWGESVGRELGARAWCSLVSHRARSKGDEAWVGLAASGPLASGTHVRQAVTRKGQELSQC